MIPILPSSIAIISSTYYPSWYKGKLQSINHTDKIRGDLAIEFVEKAIKKGFYVVITDGLSTKTFQKMLRSLDTDHLILLKRKKNFGRSPARRLAFFRASKIPHVQAIFYSEPEKVSLLNHIDQLVEPIIQNKADMVIPKREERLFKKSYPFYQFESEVEGNLLYNEQLHLHKLLPHKDNFDLFFGPRVFAVNGRIKALLTSKIRFEVGPHVLNEEYFNPEELSDALFFPVVLALKRKLRVISVTVPFHYPVLQKQNEELGKRKDFEEKRKMQKLSLLVELMHFLHYLDRRKR